jgi:nicotinamide phosphoribosyltransferase
MMKRILLMADLYKYSHWKQYPAGTTKVYSYMCARGSRVPGQDYIIWFGLQYYIKEYFLKPITTEEKLEYIEYVTMSLGPQAVDPEFLACLDELIQLRYLPLKIKSLPEGEKVPLKFPLLTITNTLPRFYWLVNFVETLLSKLWYTSTCATVSHRFRLLAEKFAGEYTDHIPYQFHNFSYRSISSEESASLADAAHLMSFLGTDTMGGIVLLNRYYNQVGTEPGSKKIGFSVPATEHSVMCMGTKDGERDTLQRLIGLYPKGILSVVIDTWNMWQFINGHARMLYGPIMKREGKLVFRPDSSPKTPLEIICGDPDGNDINERKGVLSLLATGFGSTFDIKGIAFLDSKVGVLYGDAITYEMAEKIFTKMKEQNWHSSNIVFGIGGVNFQWITRDTYNFAIKATYGVVNDIPLDIQKDPITDRKKKSACGLMTVYRNPETGAIDSFKDQCTPEEEEEGALETVFINGKLVKEVTFTDIRKKLGW